MDFRIWPIFNFADSFVTIGVIGLIVYFWKE
ncbi:MAG: signal peptidase II [Candidatus Woesearchaeota archaeon]|nr:signal peptidase II [Candidatus Woesearchaeota archaeon]MDP7263387.1 signal peptidase II [Candidatus Woesearchaeota archaeon]MDP7623245.1 signal peptidase II [Candidatus Woesearchaeota archaeon]HJN56675.1 signal peptidase II [Candidatus Woesearchaeota archaeon]